MSGHTERTEAYLDGTLSRGDAAEAERHLETCTECQGIVADREALSDALRHRATRFTAPDALRAKVTRALDDEARVVVPMKRRGFWTGAVSGAGATALAAGLALFLVLPPSAATLADAVTTAHTRALMDGQTIQVASTDHHTVKPWFATHIDVSPPVADFADAGFKLVGGRIDTVAGARAAVVVYRHGKHAIDLFVWADRGSRLPGDATRHGYRAVFWKNGDLNFAAVCDMDGAELKKFVNLVRSEPE